MDGKLGWYFRCFVVAGTSHKSTPLDSAKATPISRWVSSTKPDFLGDDNPKVQHD